MTEIDKNKELFSLYKGKKLKGFNSEGKYIATGKIVGWTDTPNHLILELNKEIGWRGKSRGIMERYFPDKIKEGQWHWYVSKQQILEGKFEIDK